MLLVSLPYHCNLQKYLNFFCAWANASSLMRSAGAIQLALSLSCLNEQFIVVIDSRLILKVCNRTSVNENNR